MDSRGRVLQNGFPRSGNLWLYNIVSRILDEAGIERSTFIEKHPVYPGLKQLDFDFAAAEIDNIDLTTSKCFAIVRDTFREAIEDLDAYVSSTRIVWSHAAWNEIMTPVVYGKFDRLLYIIRDPRDAVVSMSHFAFTPYKRRYSPSVHRSPQEWLDAEYKGFVTNWSTHVCGHLLNAKQFGIYPLFYERLSNDTHGELERLARYLGVDLPADSIDSVVRATSVEETRRVAPHHLTRARSGGWREVLSDRQARWISDRHGALLELLGYDETDSLPAFDVDDAGAIRAMRAMNRTSAPRKLARALRAAVAVWATA